MTKPADDLKHTTRAAAKKRVDSWRADPEAQKPKDEHDRSNEADDVPSQEGDEE